MGEALPIVKLDEIRSRIHLVRNRRIMLDFELAELYEVTTAALNQAVKRNINRFPPDFMFHLNKEEVDALMSQSVISKPSGRGGTRKPPSAFTEQGVAMLSSVLRSDRAIQVNIAIMRVFVRLKQIQLDSAKLTLKFQELEKAVEENSENIKLLFNAIGELIKPAEPSQKYPLGFQPSKKKN